MTWIIIGIGVWVLVVLFVITLLMARRSDEDPRVKSEHDEERRVA